MSGLGLVKKFIRLGLLCAEHGGGMRIETVSLGGEHLPAHGHVVEAAEGILQLFYRGKRYLSSFGFLMTRKDSDEKLGHVSQFLGSDPKFVTRPCIEFAQFSSLFSDLLPALDQNCARIFFNRPFSVRGSRSVVGPGADFNPLGDSEQTSTKTVRTQKVAGRGVRFTAPRCEVATDLGKLLLACIVLTQMFKYVGSEHIKIARRAKLVRGPFQPRLDLLLLGLGEELGEAGNGGAQAAQTDAHLVQCFRVASPHPRFIGYDLPKTVSPNGSEGFPDRHLWVKLDRPSLFKGRLGIFNEFIA